MPEVVTAQAANGMTDARALRTTINSDLAAAGGSYNQAAQQALVDMVNDLAQLLKNAGIAK